MPKLRFYGWPGGNGLTATLQSVGGTGTPASSYSITAVGTRVYEITIAASLVGAFEFEADGGAVAAFPIVLTGQDVDSTVGNLPTAVSDSDQAAIAAKVLEAAKANPIHSDHRKTVGQAIESGFGIS